MPHIAARLSVFRHAQADCQQPVRTEHRRPEPRRPLDMDMEPSALLVILITVLVPPIGVFMVSGCGCDVFINICLTLLGFIPGHIHAFYIEYIHYKELEERRQYERMEAAAASSFPEPPPIYYGYGATR